MKLKIMAAIAITIHAGCIVLVWVKHPVHIAICATTAFVLSIVLAFDALKNEQP